MINTPLFWNARILGEISKDNKLHNLHLSAFQHKHIVLSPILALLESMMLQE